MRSVYSPLFFVNIADKGLRHGIGSPGAAAAKCSRGDDSLEDAGTEPTALSEAIWETDRVGLNTQCTEFTEDARGGWTPPPRGVRKL